MKWLNRTLRWPIWRRTYRRLYPVQVHCRPAALADAHEVARLMEPLFPSSARREALPSAERLLSETLRSGAQYRIACQGRRILAGCQVGPLLQSAGFDGCWILGLWVHPAARGRGVGEILIQDILQSMAEEGESRLYCHIVHTNAPSLNLFRKLGFLPAPADLQQRVEAKFGAAFHQGSEICVLYRDLDDLNS